MGNSLDLSYKLKSFSKFGRDWEVGRGAGGGACQSDNVGEAWRACSACPPQERPALGPREEPELTGMWERGPLRVSGRKRRFSNTLRPPKSPCGRDTRPCNTWQSRRHLLASKKPWAVSSAQLPSSLCSQSGGSSASTPSTRPGLCTRQTHSFPASRQVSIPISHRRSKQPPTEALY